MQKILYTVAIITMATFSVLAQTAVPHHACPLPQSNTHGTGFASHLRSDNCDRQAGSIPYQNASNVLVQNSSLVFDGQCLYLNGQQICPGATGGGWNCDSTTNCFLNSPIFDSLINAINNWYSANNGITRKDDIDTTGNPSYSVLFQLGGPLIQNTIISTSPYRYLISSDSTLAGDGIKYFQNDTIATSFSLDSSGLVNSGIEVRKGVNHNVFIYSGGGNGKSGIELNRGNLTISSKRTIVPLPAYISTAAAQADATLLVNSLYVLSTPDGIVHIKF